MASPMKPDRRQRFREAADPKPATEPKPKKKASTKK